jgi:hypothetical protein
VASRALIFVAGIFVGAAWVITNEARQLINVVRP